MNKLDYKAYQLNPHTDKQGNQIDYQPLYFPNSEWNPDSEHLIEKKQFRILILDPPNVKEKTSESEF